MSGLPTELRKVLPDDAARAWEVLAPHLPRELYLGGGTAVTVYLHHRESRDLDFFFHDPVDLGTLEATIAKLGTFAVDYSDQRTLKGLFGKTKLEVFDASEIKQLEPPTEVAGLRIASLADLMAMKLKVMSERGELRDYFDVKAIDEQSSVSLEEGIEHFVRRYDAGATALQALLLAMGHFDDVEDDEALPISKDELETWWRKRQPGVIRNSNRFAPR